MGLSIVLCKERHLTSQLSPHQQCQHGECPRKRVLSSQVPVDGEKKDAGGFPDISQLLIRVNIVNKSERVGTFAHPDPKDYLRFSTTKWIFLSNLHMNRKPRWEE